MFGENKTEDAVRFGKAIITNQVARFFPRYYVHLTGETGRGQGEETSQGVAEYFYNCFSEYFNTLKIAEENIEEFLKDKIVLEYGPGDTPGVALLMYAYGAKKVFCVDRFPLVSLGQKNIKIMKELLLKLSGEKKKRAENCFKRYGDPSSGLNSSAINYLVRPNGLTGIKNEIDLIVSRAVLEHVNDLEGTIFDMKKALKKDGLAIHQVDLKSHGLHKRNRLDFLTWPSLLWGLMYSQKGVPNRIRISEYRRLVKKSSLVSVLLEPILLAELDEVAEVRKSLAKEFSRISDEDLLCLGFWLVLKRA